MKQVLILFLKILLCAVPLSLTAKPPVVSLSKPNIILINADDCTMRDIACYGGQAHTPNIDALAKEGMRFTRCFQAAPMCSPTRHNIYTGLYPVKSGAYPNHTFANPGTKSIAHYLKPLGYRVALSGKRHISPEEVFPFEYLPGKKNPDMKAIEAFMKECVEKKEPFCLFACSNEPHSPWDKGDPSQYNIDELKIRPFHVDTPAYRENYRNYLAEITYYDTQVGELLALLDKYKLKDNTLVIVLSEQGNSFPFAKWTCYDDGLASAMIVRWPDKVKAGSISNTLVEFTDIVPTFVEAADGTPDPALDGKSMLPIYLGKKKHHKKYTFGIMTTRGIKNGTDYPIRTVRDKKYRLIVNLIPNADFRNVVYKDKYFKEWQDMGAGGHAKAKDVINRYTMRPAIELYDVVNDPDNFENLASNPKYARTIKKLRAKLDAWMLDQGDLGIETELAAYEHQKRNNKGKKKNK